MSCIEARGLRKHYGKSVALDGIDLRVDEGRIVGLIGPNGAGKSTACTPSSASPPTTASSASSAAIPGPTATPSCATSASSPTSPSSRAGSMSPRPSTTSPACTRASTAPAPTASRPHLHPQKRKVKTLSKGMTVQLHLALVMAIDAKLLVLDEPTLGLDLLYRKQFYDALLNDYFDGRRTILITTHQVEEIQDLLTDLLFIQRGRIVLDTSMDAIEARYTEVMVRPEQPDAARTFNPLRERHVFGRSIMLFDNVPREQLQQLGEVRTPSIADLFVATMEESQARQEVIQ